MRPEDPHEREVFSEVRAVLNKSWKERHHDQIHEILGRVEKQGNVVVYFISGAYEFRGSLSNISKAFYVLRRSEKPALQKEESEHEADVDMAIENTRQLPAQPAQSVTESDADDLVRSFQNLSLKGNDQSDGTPPRIPHHIETAEEPESISKARDQLNVVTPGNDSIEQPETSSSTLLDEVKSDNLEEPNDGYDREVDGHRLSEPPEDVIKTSEQENMISGRDNDMSTQLKTTEEYASSKDGSKPPETDRLTPLERVPGSDDRKEPSACGDHEVAIRSPETSGEFDKTSAQATDKQNSQKTGPIAGGSEHTDQTADASNDNLKANSADHDTTEHGRSSFDKPDAAEASDSTAANSQTPLAELTTKDPDTAFSACVSQPHNHPKDSLTSAVSADSAVESEAKTEECASVPEALSRSLATGLTNDEPVSSDALQHKQLEKEHLISGASGTHVEDLATVTDDESCKVHGDSAHSSSFCGEHKPNREDSNDQKPAASAAAAKDLDQFNTISKDSLPTAGLPLDTKLQPVAVDDHSGSSRSNDLQRTKDKLYAREH